MEKLLEKYLEGYRDQWFGERHGFFYKNVMTLFDSCNSSYLAIFETTSKWP